MGKKYYRTKMVTRHPILGTGTFYLHRVIVTERIGRLLRRDEHVHHVNGDIHDNRDWNLELWPAKKHHEHHAVNFVRPEDIGERISLAKKGVALTVKHKKALSRAHRGRPKSEEFKAAVAAKMRERCAALPPGEMARRSQMRKKT